MVGTANLTDSPDRARGYQFCSTFMSLVCCSLRTAIVCAFSVSARMFHARLLLGSEFVYGMAAPLWSVNGLVVYALCWFGEAFACTIT